MYESATRTSVDVCVIGAGSSGLAVVRRLVEHGIGCVCLERETALGGNWRYGSPASSVAASTHLISSKAQTEYPGFPMPDHWPEYVSHQLALEYLERFAERYELHPHIRYGCGVELAERHPEGGWSIQFTQDDRPARQLVVSQALVVANGHNRSPRWPGWAGRFAGAELHAGDYRTPDMLRGRRVLIVGAGNSGCDIAVESAAHATRTVLSMRRGYHFLPKFWRGLPIDQVGEGMLRLGLPLAVRRQLARLVAYLMLGSPRSLGFPRPDHKLFETHPVINSQLFYCAAHGGVAIKPDVVEVQDRSVRFSDGSIEEFDVIVCATGYEPTVRFLAEGTIPWRGGRPDLYLNVLHPSDEGLYFAGFIQPDSGQWGLVDRQAELIARCFAGLRSGTVGAARLRARASHGAGPVAARYLATPRHALEVEHYSYRRELERAIARLRRRAGSYKKAQEAQKA